MATIPDLAAVKAYLGTDHSWSDSEIQAALDAQAGDQAKKAVVPPTRTVDVATALDSPTLTGVSGDFTTSEVGSAVSGAGIPAGAVVVSVDEVDGITATLDMNATATAASVTVTVAAQWPESLRQALCRRTQVALSLQPLPLGMQATLIGGDTAAVRVGSPTRDPLVSDLERPYRKLVVG
jgi:hypothetical protein